MATGTSRKATLEFLARFASCVERAAERTSMTQSNAYARLRDVIAAQEREHRAFGRRLVGDKDFQRTLYAELEKAFPGESPRSVCERVWGLDYAEMVK